MMRQHTKTLGQVFLHDPNIIRKIVAFAQPKPHHPIIEIGCGKGILTTALSDVGPVYAIEIDSRWVTVTRNHALPNTTIIHADALTIDYEQFQKHSPIIANIPYHITAPLIETFTRYNHHLGPITIMIQSDMARRLLSQPGTKQYGAMTIFCSYHFTIMPGFFVSRHCFSPPPNVDSYVVTLVPKPPALSHQDEALFFKMTRTFFWGRRKTMHTTLTSGPYIQLTRPLPDGIRESLRHRGETLSLNQLLELFHTLRPYLSIRA